MPYARNKDLPRAIRSVLPVAGQTIFRNVVNSQLDRGLSEQRAFSSAWGALKNQGWEKGPGGQWRKTKMSKVSMLAKIEKMDEEQQLVFGWASVIEENGDPVVDSQGDLISEQELEKAFYDFVLNARNAGEMHLTKDAGKLVECIVFTKEKQKALGIDLGKVGAWVGFKVKEEVFKKVKSGEYSMFSIGGIGTREAVDE